MKVGIIGAPGAGKTALAHALKERLDGTVGIIDGYTDLIEQRGKFVVGPFGSYATNVGIALLRLAFERTAETETTITCGTHVESCLYTALDGMRHQTYAPTEDFKLGMLERTETAMRFIAALMVDSQPYDLLVYLPLTEEPAEGWVKQFDDQIEEACEMYGVAAIKLEGTAEECVDQAQAAIALAADEKAEPDGEQE